MDVIDVEKEFQTYSNRLFDGYDKLIEMNQLKVRTEIAFLEVYYFFLKYVVDKGLLHQRHKTEQVLYAKISTDLLGILSNLCFGCVTQAMTLLRSLLETCIYAKFIEDEPKFRIELYSDFAIVEKYRIRKTDRTLTEDLITQYNQVKYKYDANGQWYSKCLNDIIKSNDSLRKKKPSIRTLSIVAGMESDYKQLYSVLSNAGHENSILENVFIQDGKFNSDPSYLPNWNELIARLSVNYASKGIKSILSLNKSNNVEVFINYSELLACNIILDSNTNTD